VIAEAPPSITSVATRTCFKSITRVVSAAIATASNRAVSEAAVPIAMVNVPAEAAVLVTTTLSLMLGLYIDSWLGLLLPLHERVSC
jgi:hypothetical protein